MFYLALAEVQMESKIPKIFHLSSLMILTLILAVFVIWIICTITFVWFILLFFIHNFFFYFIFVVSFFCTLLIVLLIFLLFFIIQFCLFLYLFVLLVYFTSICNLRPTYSNKFFSFFLIIFNSIFSEIKHFFQFRLCHF